MPSNRWLPTSRAQPCNLHALAGAEALVATHVGDQDWLALTLHALQHRLAEDDLRLLARLWLTVANFRCGAHALLIKQHDESAFNTLDAEGEQHHLFGN